MLTSIEIGKKLREIRKQRGLTQEQLAEKIDVSFQQIGKYENGASMLNTDKLQTLSDALNVPISAFFGEQDVERTLHDDEILLIRGYRSLNESEKSFVLRIVRK